MTNNAKQQFAGVYLRGPSLFIEPVDVLVSGIQRGSEPVTILSALATDEAVGAAVGEVLVRTRYNLPHPATWNSAVPIVQAAGCRSWSAFAKTALYCSVALGAMGYHLAPTRREEPRYSFGYFPERDLLLPVDSTPDQLGAGVRQSLEISKELSGVI